MRAPVIRRRVRRIMRRWRKERKVRIGETGVRRVKKRHTRTWKAH